jgi:hypothetical protein
MADDLLTGFEVFRGKGSITADEPKLTIQTKGILGLNAASYELLGRPQEVELLYNASRQMMALRPARPGQPHTYKVRPTTGPSVRGSYTVAARAFLKTYGVTYRTSIRYSPTKVGDLLVVDLTEAGSSATRTVRSAGGGLEE